MTLPEKEKLQRLRDVFDKNYRVSRLFATYLEHFPEIITKELVSSLTDDGGLTEKEAVTALLSEIFGLNIEDASDREIIRNYLSPAISVLDTKKYTENKYYKNIKIENARDGDWELRREVYPAYRGFVSGDMILAEDFSEIAPLGFFTTDFEFPAVLEGGNEWMTLTPVDLDTCEAAIDAARGRVVTFGLGLGYYAYMSSEKDEVSEIVVVERSEAVIRLFKKYILPHFSHPEKVKIVCEDAFVYARDVMPGESFDLAFVDIWRDGSDGSEMYKKMKPYEPLSPKTRFLYWIEGFIVSRLRAQKFEILYEDVTERGANISYSEIVKSLTETDLLIKE